MIGSCFLVCDLSQSFESQIPEPVQYELLVVYSCVQPYLKLGEQREQHDPADPGLVVAPQDGREDATAASVFHTVLYWKSTQ